MKNRIFHLLGIFLSVGSHIYGASPGEVKWTLPLGSYSCPAIGRDGTIYICVGSELHAISPLGTNLWTIVSANDCYGSPAIGIDGTIYFGGQKLYAVEPNGSNKWEFATQSMIASSPSIGADGTIYIGSSDRQLYALRPDGTKKWAVRTGSISWSSSAIGNDGVIYVGQADSSFCAINPDGTVKWKKSLNPVELSPSIIGNTTIYFVIGAKDVPGKELCVMEASGNELWRNSTDAFSAPPVFGKNGIMYLGSVLGGVVRLSAVDPSTRSVLWRSGGGNLARWYLPVTPAVADDGTIYFGGGVDSHGDSFFYAINPDGTTNWQRQVPGFVQSSPAIGPDGTIYFSTGPLLGTPMTFYALAGGSPLADSPWPKDRQNLRNTGKVEKVRLRSPRRADAFQFDLYGQAGESYRIEASPDLGTWTTLTSLVYSTFPFTFVDDASPEPRIRFYRAVSP